MGEPEHAGDDACGSRASAEAHGPRPRRLLAASCWAYLLALVGAWLVLRQAGDRWWPATLLLFAPRWPFAVPAVVLWPWVIAARRRRVALLLSAATAVLLGPLVGLRAALPLGDSDAPHDLRLLTCNIHRQQLDADQLAALIAAARPDVVALQDWSTVHQERLFGTGGWDVRRHGELLVASRFPIARVTPIDLSSAGGPAAIRRGAAACFDLRTSVGPVRLINVHLASPHAALLAFPRDWGRTLEENAARRWRESAAVRDVVDKSTSPVLLAGDFNTTDDSPIFRHHWADFVNASATRGFGIGHTYVNRRTQLRIDHVLAGPHWQPVRCRVGPAVGSPHRPVVADVRFR